jgi:hypothetical protein
MTSTILEPNVDKAVPSSRAMLNSRCLKYWRDVVAPEMKKKYACALDYERNRGRVEDYIRFSVYLSWPHYKRELLEVSKNIERETRYRKRSARENEAKRVQYALRKQVKYLFQQIKGYAFKEECSTLST